MRDETKSMKLIGALSYDSYSLQHIIDVDKYVAGEELGYDVCGTYAPFCKACSKSVANPCATAYRINERMSSVCPMLDSTGADDARVVQAVTDVDKYLASEGFGLDLCGRYAPFCAVCDKSQPMPCGQAYLRLKAVENFSTKALAAQEGGQLVVNMPRWDDALTQALEDASASVNDVAEVPDGSEIVAAPLSELDSVQTVALESGSESTVTVTAPRRGFRIGTARRRVPVEKAENVQ